MHPMQRMHVEQCNVLFEHWWPLQRRTEQRSARGACHPATRVALGEEATWEDAGTSLTKEFQLQHVEDRKHSSRSVP